jgi:putative acetyltransferase
VLIESRPVLDPELAVLVTAEQRETGADRAPRPDAAYLVAVVDGRAVACGAWQPLPDGSAELAQLYVRPAFRGRGIAGQLVVALEEEALAAGQPVIRVPSVQ